jgi:hypothetical protein
VIESVKNDLSIAIFRETPDTVKKPDCSNEKPQPCGHDKSSPFASARMVLDQADIEHQLNFCP